MWPGACHACFGVPTLEVTERTDEQLAAEAAREGSDGPAFVALVERFRQRVWRICYRLLGNEQDANDAAQEVFVRLFTQPDQVRRPLQVCHLGARHRGAHLLDDSPRTRTPTTTRRHGQRRAMGTATANAKADAERPVAGLDAHARDSGRRGSGHADPQVRRKLRLRGVGRRSSICRSAPARCGSREPAKNCNNDFPTKHPDPMDRRHG